MAMGRCRPYCLFGTATTTTTLLLAFVLSCFYYYATVTVIVVADALAVQQPKQQQQKQQSTTVSTSSTTSSSISSSTVNYYYADYWERLLLTEYRETINQLRLRRKTRTRRQLEDTGVSIFDVSAVPDSEVLGEKIVRLENVHHREKTTTRWRNVFSRGDVLLMTPEPTSRARQFFGGYSSSRRNKHTRRRMIDKSPSNVPKECLVVDVGNDWMTVAVGPSWPVGLWESRKSLVEYKVRLDRMAPKAPLLAQRTALDKVRKGQAGSAADILARILYYDDSNSIDEANQLASSMTPDRFSSTKVEEDDDGGTTTMKERIQNSMARALEKTNFRPNESQISAIKWALQRRISLIRGPPGTGKTRVAAALVSTALNMMEEEEKLHHTSTSSSNNNSGSSKANNNAPPNRVLAITNSNGAADVLLESLLQMGVPAVRLGRPASVSSHLQHRTVVAMADKMPQVVRLRQMSSDMSLSKSERSGAAFELRQTTNDVQQLITETAPVLVTTCIGAHQLMSLSSEEEDDDTNDDIAADSDESPDKMKSPSSSTTTARGSFPLVVLDEAAQTTEPALVCALAAARAEQLVLVGDTRQLPPTITCMEVLDSLGVSPMTRLEKSGVGETTLQIQYRMPPSLLKFPSKYFYNNLVICAPEKLIQANNTAPAGFHWPTSDQLAFVHVGDGNSELPHVFGGKSNPTESKTVIQIVSNLLAAGDVEATKIGIISPYAKQIQLIRSELSAMRNMQDVRVGTVDSFQGQETDIIIFSAVRSNPLKEIGFLRDSRRLCVAITRARRALILVGDQGTLKACRHWERLLESLDERGCVMDRADLLPRQVLPGTTTLDGFLEEQDIVKSLFGEEVDLFGLPSLDHD